MENKLSKFECGNPAYATLYVEKILHIFCMWKNKIADATLSVKIKCMS